MFSSAGPDALDLLRKCLTFNPEKRISVEDALQHKYVEQFHCMEDEVTCDKIIKIPINDNTKLSLKRYRDAIYEDITNKIKQHKKKL